MNRRLATSVLVSVTLLLLLACVVGAQSPLRQGDARANEGVEPPVVAASGSGGPAGLYLFNDDGNEGIQPSQYPIVGGFKRFNWRDLEPTQGVYDWAKLTLWINKHEAEWLGAIGFSTFNGYRGYGSDSGVQVPQWLLNQYPNVQRYNSQTGHNLVDYTYWAYQQHYQSFINAFAQYLADNPAVRSRVAWVSTGTGLQGETQPTEGWTEDGAGREEDWYFYKDNIQMTSAEWVAYIGWCCSTYRQAFNSRGMSDMPMFVDIGPTYGANMPSDQERDAYAQHAVANQVGLRNNGLQPDNAQGAISFKPLREYNDVTNVSWETYRNYLGDKGGVWWGICCGLAKHPHNFAFDELLWQVPEYLPLFEFAQGYCGVDKSNTPGAWVALRQTKHPLGEQGNYTFWVYQNNGVTGGETVPVWDVGQKREYRFDVQNGVYQVELHFAMVYPGYNTSGIRVFDIEIEDLVVEDNFDIWVAAGGRNKPVSRSYSTSVADGQLRVMLRPEWSLCDDYPTISAIKVTGPGGYEKKINCGGPDHVDQGTELWVADREYEEGQFGYWGGYPAGPYGEDIDGAEDDLYGVIRVLEGASLYQGRFARRTDQATGNTRMYFNINNEYMYYGTFDQAVITVTYNMMGTDSWELRYDAIDNVDKVATPAYGTTQKDDSKLWKQAVFVLNDARFANGHPGSTDFSINCKGDGDEYVSFVEVSKGGHGPELATLQGQVTLEGGNRPDWSVPLAVTIGSTPHTVQTNASGGFTLSSLTPGTYDILVKNAHTLSRLRSSVTLNAGTNAVDFGTLLEGDADGNDIVNSNDFSILATAYYPKPYDARADFNEDDYVQSMDFSLLATNFNKSGEGLGMGGQALALAGVGMQDGTVTMDLSTPSSPVAEGEIFGVEIRVLAGSQALDVAEVHINFDPLYLQVVEEDGVPASTVEGGVILDVPLQNRVDNDAGEIDYAAGTFGAQPSDTFVLATIRFKALLNTAGSGTPLVFVHQLPRKTDVNYEGSSVLADAIGGSVAIDPGYRIYLPLAIRSGQS